MRNNSQDPTPYAVFCYGEHKDKGPQFLSEEQYIAQLERPDMEWRCPKCNDLAKWDDDCQETNQ